MFRWNKKNRGRTGGRYKALLFVFLAIGFISVCAAGGLSIRLTDITVTGCEKYTQEEMKELLFSGKWGYHTAYAYYKDKTKNHEKIPFVEDYKLVFQGLNQIEVIVYEKSIVGCIQYMSNYMYFDKDGIIVETSGEQIEKIPLIGGLHYGHVVLHQPLPVENEAIFQDILNLTQILSSKEIVVESIRFDSLSHITLYINDDKAVYLGSSEMLDLKVLDLKSMLPDLLKEGPGTLRLDTFSESGSGNYSFIKDKAK